MTNSGRIVEGACVSATARAPKVLVVDDEVAKLERIKNKLPAHYNAVFIDRIRLAKVNYVDTPPDIGIVDCMLAPTGGNGVDLAIEIDKAVSNGRRLPFVMYTMQSKHQEEIVELCNKAREAGLNVLAWLFSEDHPEGQFDDLAKDVVAVLETQFYPPWLRSVESMLKKQHGEAERSMLEELHRYQEIVGGIGNVHQIRSYDGHIDLYRPPHGGDYTGEGRALFEGKGYRFAWTFSGEKLKAAGAYFTGARVRWDIYVAGATMISALRCVGPALDKPDEDSLLDTLSPEELEGPEK